MNCRSEEDQHMGLLLSAEELNSQIGLNALNDKHDWKLMYIN